MALESLDIVWPVGTVLMVGPLLTCFRLVTEHGGPTRSATCVGCGYLMDGLGESAICPECGHNDPRVRLGRTRTVVRVVATPSAGMALGGFVAVLAMILHPIIWEIVHASRCTIRFGRLDGETLLGAFTGATLATVLYMVILPFVRDRWAAAASWLGAASAAGSIVGLVIASRDPRLWHGRALEQVTLASCAAVVLAAVIVPLALRPRRAPTDAHILN